MTTKITDKNISNIANMGIEWQSKVTSDGSTVTQLSAGKGYFIDNTSAAGLVKLPAPDDSNAGDSIAIKDYAGNFGTNNLTIQRNTNIIQGVENDGKIITDRASLVLVYVDSTKGWIYTNESNVADLQSANYVAATGGTVTTSGNFKIHTFTGDGCFVVSCAGNAAGNNKVDYLVLAGGGAGGTGGNNDGGAGGGAGGFRESYTPAVSGPYTASPLKADCGALTVTATTFPVTVGGGGAAATSGNAKGPSGSNSVFSTITSAGGGGGGGNGTSGGHAGGSGGGGHQAAGSSGNTPPVSPPQGNDGGNGSTPTGTPSGAGGGGATAAGTNASAYNPGPNNGGPGGNGATSEIYGSSLTKGGGGGAANSPGRPTAGTIGTGGSGGGGNGGDSGVSATANLGGGGGGGADGNSGSGGKGIVVLRYKFQGS